ncbi:hypothetical protein GCM10022233_40970 [Streptomyces shaanxiensis]|uniref:Uncharacterized protein n=1 Tax=Streptomyces shaanxiensis TaxID=653357 RepID=A0ABP7VCA4_9ACTN
MAGEEALLPRTACSASAPEPDATADQIVVLDGTARHDDRLFPDRIQEETGNRTGRQSRAGGFPTAPA